MNEFDIDAILDSGELEIPGVNDVIRKKVVEGDEDDDEDDDEEFNDDEEEFNDEEEEGVEEEVAIVKINVEEESLFSFNKNDLSYLGTLAKNNKFFYKTNEIIYPKTNSEQLEYFIKCMRFIYNLINQLNGDEKVSNLQNKLCKIYDEYYELFNSCLILTQKYNNSVNFNKNGVLIKINDLYLTNKEKIHDIIDFIYPLGMVVKQFNPDNEQGYY